MTNAYETRKEEQRYHEVRQGEYIGKDKRRWNLKIMKDRDRDRDRETKENLQANSNEKNKQQSDKE